MGSVIEFASNGSTDVGYLALPADGSGPGIVVIQEWWGLVDHIRDVCERFAAEGFVALAPDLYHGVKVTEPDEAAKLMMALELDRAARDMGGAVDEVAARSSGNGVGVVGFCMGGGLALMLASNLPLAPGSQYTLFVPASLSTLLTGFILLITRRKALSQVVGYLVLENGIYLFGLMLVEEMPLLVETGILLDLFVSIFVMGIVINHITVAFDSMDTRQLAELKD